MVPASHGCDSGWVLVAWWKQWERVLLEAIGVAIHTERQQLRQYINPNNAHMELYSGLISLDIPCTNCTEVVSSKYILVFNEWLDLADENDIVRVDIVRQY